MDTHQTWKPALIALDLDGTLLHSDHLTISERNLAALRAASALGTQIVLASGRTICLIEDCASAIGVVDYVIASNGAGVMNWHTKEWLSHTGIPYAQCGSILRILNRRGLAAETYADGMAFLTKKDLQGLEQLDFSKEFMAYFKQKIAPFDDVGSAIQGKIVEKFHLFHVPPQDLAERKAELSATGPLFITSSGPANLELTAPGADKGTALNFLCGRLGIPPELVMAFGDGDNDLQMLAWVGQSYAMENGSPNSKATARFIAPPNHQSGVGQIIELFL